MVISYSRQALLSFKDHEVCQKAPEDLVDLDPLISREAVEALEKTGAIGRERPQARREWEGDSRGVEGGIDIQVRGGSGRGGDGWRPSSYGQNTSEPILGPAPRSWERPLWDSPNGPQRPPPPGFGRGAGHLSGSVGGRWDNRMAQGMSPRFRDGDNDNGIHESPPYGPRRTFSGPLRPGWGPEPGPGPRGAPPGFTTHGFRPAAPYNRTPSQHPPHRSASESLEDTFNGETFGSDEVHLTDKQKESLEQKRREEFEALRQAHRRRLEEQPAAMDQKQLDEKKHDEDFIWDNMSREGDPDPSPRTPMPVSRSLSLTNSRDRAPEPSPRGGLPAVRTLPISKGGEVALRPQRVVVPPGFARPMAQSAQAPSLETSKPVVEVAKEPSKEDSAVPATSKPEEPPLNTAEPPSKPKPAPLSEPSSPPEAKRGHPPSSKHTSSPPQALPHLHQPSTQPTLGLTIAPDVVSLQKDSKNLQTTSSPSSKASFQPAVAAALGLAPARESKGGSEGLLEDPEKSLGAGVEGSPLGQRVGSLPKENMLEKLLRSSSGRGSSKIFAGLAEDDKVLTSAVLEDMWAPETAEDDTEQSRFARWFKDVEGPVNKKSQPADATSAPNATGQKQPPATAAKPAKSSEPLLAPPGFAVPAQTPPPGSTQQKAPPPGFAQSPRNPPPGFGQSPPKASQLPGAIVGVHFAQLGGEKKTVPKGPSLEEIEQAMVSENSTPKPERGVTPLEETAINTQLRREKGGGKEDPLASLFGGAFVGAKKTGESAEAAPAGKPVFMTLEDIERSLLGGGPHPTAGQENGGELSGAGSPPAACNAAGMQLLALLQKGAGVAAAEGGQVASAEQLKALPAQQPKAPAQQPKAPAQHPKVPAQQDEDGGNSQLLELLGALEAATGREGRGAKAGGEGNLRGLLQKEPLGASASSPVAATLLGGVDKEKAAKDIESEVKEGLSIVTGSGLLKTHNEVKLAPGTAKKLEAGNADVSMPGQPGKVEADEPLANGSPEMLARRANGLLSTSPPGGWNLPDLDPAIIRQGSGHVDRLPSGDFSRHAGLHEGAPPGMVHQSGVPFMIGARPPPNLMQLPPHGMLPFGRNDMPPHFMGSGPYTSPGFGGPPPRAGFGMPPHLGLGQFPPQMQFPPLGNTPPQGGGFFPPMGLRPFHSFPPQMQPFQQDQRQAGQHGQVFMRHSEQGHLGDFQGHPAMTRVPGQPGGPNEVWMKEVGQRGSVDMSHGGSIRPEAWSLVEGWQR